MDIECLSFAVRKRSKNYRKPAIHQVESCYWRLPATTAQKKATSLTWDGLKRSNQRSDEVEQVFRPAMRFRRLSTCSIITANGNTALGHPIISINDSDYHYSTLACSSRVIATLRMFYARDTSCIQARPCYGLLEPMYRRFSATGFLPGAAVAICHQKNRFLVPDLSSHWIANDFP
ncbi:hypothetical protein [Pseudomonas cichorii]|uniref:hypothetical protein n=1 Tax=Pseudomonas cichorii TaxID=36746 RepID=UPI0011C467D2|nr:hypothetical protein [Pseudomonas cichorii]